VLRYFLLRNGEIETYQFTVTNTAALHRMLIEDGFNHQPSDNAYLRNRFSPEEISALRTEAASLHALEPQVTVQR